MKVKKYVTVGNDHKGLNYREIAEIMTEEGHKMNHSSVRNYIVRSFTKVAETLSQNYGLNYDAEEIDRIAKSPEFQHALIDVMKSEWK
jgi:hypothetical protein